MQRNIPNLPWYKRIIRRECGGKVKVVRTYSYSESHTSLGRLLRFLSFSLSCPLGLLSVAKPDVVLASTPPIFPMFPAVLICRIRQIPLVLEVRDLWPASAVQMGILGNPQLISIICWLERFLYNQSKKIVALTEGIRDDICSRGWSESKVELVTCGVDLDKLYPDIHGGALIREKLGCAHKKIVLYFGALGEANNVSVTLRAAQRLQSRVDIVFILIGDGIKRDEIKMRVERLGIKNVRLLPPVPKDEARLYINAADVCLVTLRDIPLFNGAIPTKLIDYMACGKPVICGIRGEAKNIVEAAGAGVIFEPDDDEHLSKLIVDLLSDKALSKNMGIEGFSCVQNRFSAVKMRQKMEKILIVASNITTLDESIDGIR